MDFITSTTWIGLLVGAFFFLVLSPFLSRRDSLLINAPRLFELSYSKARRRFLTQSEQLIKEGFEKASARTITVQAKNGFRIVTDTGVTLILPVQYLKDVRDADHLSFTDFTEDIFHSHIRGFEAFRPNSMLHEAIHLHLNRSLGNLVRPLSETTTAKLKAVWTDNSEWHPVAVMPTIVEMFTEISSRIMLGEELYKNTDWLETIEDFNVDSYNAINALRLWPKRLRPLVANLMPSVRQVRREVRRARQIINPVVEQRRISRDTAVARCEEPPQWTDSLGWIDEAATKTGQAYDPGVAQLGLSLGSINTAADMVTQLIFDLCGRDQLTSDLRTEIITVLREEGVLNKSTLYRLKLLDIMVTRVAQQQVQLRDNIVIPKGGSVAISNYEMRSANSPIHENADTFDGYRFYNLRRKTGVETWTQFVSTGPKHLGFGFGQYACPGRFFAADAIKVFMCHVLLKYDFRLVGDSRPEPSTAGFSLMANATASIAIRRRIEETVLEDLPF
ncbi:hypothetical protein CFD26_105355 [Aspergillus turcosus]|uniref:Cytochrome P450 n=1 Tax=Aspergillus turcosus TaxID=1245748 RepID=A0A421D5S3_9EURO|nr:hypothetical protein CFD26_105355 [Aspergillus turcosus]